MYFPISSFRIKTIKKSAKKLWHLLTGKFQTKWDVCKKAGQFQTTPQVQQNLKTFCQSQHKVKIHTDTPFIEYLNIILPWRICPFHLPPCPLLIYPLTHFFFTHCMWPLQLLLCMSSFWFFFQFLNRNLCLSQSESMILMNEIPFRQDASTAVTQNSICCLLCKIPPWIGALSFLPGASYES